MHSLPFRRIKRMSLLLAGMLLLAALAGCGKQPTHEENDAQPQDAPSGDALEGDVPEEDAPADDEGQAKEQQPEELPELSEEELSAMQYIEKTSVEDYFGNGACYDAYVPKGSENEDGMVSYFEHGISYFASAVNAGSKAFLYEYMNDTVKYAMTDWQGEETGYADIQLGGMMKNGEDIYQIAKAKKEDVYGTQYEVTKVFYLDVQEEGAGIIWDLELAEISADEETERILDELGACYRVNLDEAKTSGGWLAADQERAEERQDVYEPEEGDIVLEEVEGYRYMGVATLSAKDGEAECPVMAPRGWSVSVRDNYVSSYMHGVTVHGSLGMIAGQRFMWNVEDDSGMIYDIYQEDAEKYRNVQKSEMMPIDGYEEALYVIFTYEELDGFTEEYQPYARAECYIRVNDDYMLLYSIRLSYNEYDHSTNTVIKELETAYGIDLSKYYYEEEN